MKDAFLRNSFFLSAVNESDKLVKIARKAESLKIFKENILEFQRPSQNKVYGGHNPTGIKTLTRLGLGFSQLREQKFKHSFRNTLKITFTLVKILKLHLTTFFIAQTIYKKR